MQHLMQNNNFVGANTVKNNGGANLATDGDDQYDYSIPGESVLSSS